MTDLPQGLKAEKGLALSWATSEPLQDPHASLCHQRPTRYSGCKYIFLTKLPGLCVACVCVNWISVQLTAPIPAAGRKPSSLLKCPAPCWHQRGDQPPSSICLLRQTAVISSPRAFCSAPEALLLCIPLSFHLLTPGFILGLNYVWLTLALRQSNFIFVLRRQEGNCWSHHFLFIAKR